MRLRRQKMNKEMFDVIQHIGKDTGQVYAMKSLLKKDVILKHQVNNIILNLKPVSSDFLYISELHAKRSYKRSQRNHVIYIYIYRYYGPENDSQPSHTRIDSLSLPPEVAGLEQHMKVNIFSYITDNIIDDNKMHFYILKNLGFEHSSSEKRDQAHSVVGTGNYMAPEVIEKTGKLLDNQFN
uniref:Protein kinase domain-containing protein n=1 Tax=Heterorhabditis bacteriophora TaxID=37862 RepID=A0A1I7WSC4_HETBA